MPNCSPHNNPANYEIRNGKAYCKLCGKFIGYVKELK